MTLTFKPIVGEELIAACYAIEQRAHWFPWSFNNFTSSLVGRYFHAALCEGEQVLGFYIAEYIAGEASLMDICVSPAAQGRGLGQQLLAHCIDTARAKGAEQMWLEVRVSNTSAIHIYEKAGFNQTGVRPNYYEGVNGDEDAYLYCLVLHSPFSE